MTLRVAFGSCLVEDCTSEKERDLFLKNQISLRMTFMKTQSFESLCDFKDITQSLEHSEKEIFISTYVEKIEGKNLVIVQGSYSSFWPVNFISLKFIGNLLVDAFLIDENNEISKPDRELLIQYT